MRALLARFVRHCVASREPGDPLIDTLIERGKARPVANCERFDPELQREATRRRIAQLQASLGDDAGARVVSIDERRRA